MPVVHSDVKPFAKGVSRLTKTLGMKTIQIDYN